MLMPRYSEQDNHKDHGHASTTVAAHTKMRLLSKVEQNMRQQQQQQQQQQNQSISKIIHTAATGNGLVGDVDELLTPMRIKAHASPPPSSLSSGGSVSLNSSNSSMDSGGGGKDTSQSRPERNLWSRMEMLEMLKIMQQMNALELLNDRNVKSEQVFRQIEQVMRNKGYVKKSSIQIWTKWKFLKSTYNTTTRHGNGIPKVVHEEVYRVLARMLREHANANGSGSGISSECGNSMDSSNAELNKTTNNSDDGKEDMGVEHPIFGFCLGLIKPEPMDNGYETPLKIVNAPEPETESVDFIQNEERNDQDAALDHIPFTVTVKNEPEMDLGMDGTNTPPPTAPTSPSPPPLLLAPGPLESTKTPPTTLRVAAFANDTPRIATAKPTPTHGVLQIERPMPALSRNPLNGGPSKANRSMPLHSTSSINFVHPTSKLMLPRKQLPVRIPREISVQPARVSAMKMVPMRETGYSLRPDRMIPDLEQSISPPQSPSPPMPKYSMPSYASTSRQAQQLLTEQQQQPIRKRRLQFMQQTPTPVPVKLQRSGTQHETKPYPPDEQQSALADEYRQKLAAEETQRRKQQQEELFKTELTQLASAMHTAQTDMLADFFRQQKILARREHEFQLRQDNMVLSALRKQTDALLRTAKELLQTNANEPTETQQQQDEMEDRSSTMLLLQPEVELHETQDNREDEETEEPQDERADDDEEEEEENDTQYSEDYNQSETGMEMSMSMSMSAASEDASNHGAANLADDAQITC